jgi:Arc/MetJ-type ribon-helix-helix transcriptional regulator
MKKPSKTVSVQLPTEDIKALESLIGQTFYYPSGEIIVKRLSDAMRYAMRETIGELKKILEDERIKAEKAAAAKAKREAKKAAANGL